VLADAGGEHQHVEAAQRGPTCRAAERSVVFLDRVAGSVPGIRVNRVAAATRLTLQEAEAGCGSAAMRGANRY